MKYGKPQKKKVYVSCTNVPNIWDGGGGGGEDVSGSINSGGGGV